MTPMVNEALLQLNHSQQEFDVFENTMSQIEANMKQRLTYQILSVNWLRQKRGIKAWTSL